MPPSALHLGLAVFALWGSGSAALAQAAPSSPTLYESGDLTITVISKAA